MIVIVFKKNVLISTSYTPLNTQTLNYDHKINTNKKLRG